MTLKLGSICPYVVLFPKYVWAKPNKTVQFLYTGLAVCTALFVYLAPAGSQYCQQITEELQLNRFALIGPIDGL